MKAVICFKKKKKLYFFVEKYCPPLLYNIIMTGILYITGRNKFAQAELDKLSTEYGKLLGHQNQKQKIHHIIKIKEENNNLKKVK